MGLVFAGTSFTCWEIWARFVVLLTFSIAVYIVDMLLHEGKKMGIPMKPNKREDLVYVKELIGSVKVAPVIDRRYPLIEVAKVLRYLEEGEHRGITVEKVCYSDEH